MSAKNTYRKRCVVQPLPEVRIPQRLPLPEGRRLVRVLVEGYEDVAFWRSIFDHYESSCIAFEISVPPRADLAKGKKTLLGLGHENKDTILCMDSDFDYLFADQTAQAKLINSSPYMFHTYTYATENYICYAPSLHNVCVKATKNDARIFDFELFFAQYSAAIFPAFLWYVYSAQIMVETMFPLIDFRNTVRLGYLDITDNGRSTIEWLTRQVNRRVDNLRQHYPGMEEKVWAMESQLLSRGVSHQNAYLFMHGHTLMDNVVMVVLNTVCDKLKMMTNQQIDSSARQGQSLDNEKSNYKNSLYNVRDALLFNENYKDCFLYRKLQSDIETYLATNNLIDCNR